MRNLIHTRERKPVVEGHFSICILLSVLVHFLFLQFGLTARTAKDFRIRDKKKVESLAVEDAAPQREIFVRLTTEEPDAVAFTVAPSIRMATQRLKNMREKPKRENIAEAPAVRLTRRSLKITENESKSNEQFIDAPEIPTKEMPSVGTYNLQTKTEKGKHIKSPSLPMLSYSPAVREARIGMKVKERALDTKEVFLKAPHATKKDLPRFMGVTRRSTFREKLKQQVISRKERIAKWKREEHRKRTARKPSRAASIEKVLLKNILPPEKKISIPLLTANIKTALAEAPNIISGSKGQATAKAETLALKGGKTAPSPKSLKGGSKAKPEYLPVPQPSMPRVLLNGKKANKEELEALGGLGGYKMYLLEKIKSAGFYPSNARLRGEQGAVTVRFALSRIGKLGKVYVHKASKFTELDSAAVTMVRKAAPESPFPDYIKIETILFEIDIVFKLGG